MPQLDGKIRLLLVGPLPLNQEALGGAKTAFLKTVEYISACDDYLVTVINTSRRISSSTDISTFVINILTVLKISIPYILAARKSDAVMINMSSGGVLSIGWVYVALAKLCSCKVILRVFGGSLYDKLERLPGFWRLMSDRMFARLDLLVLETKYLCDAFHSIKNVCWLPNCRDIHVINKDRQNISSIVFLSHVRKDKGVVELLDASNDLPDNISLKMYGSLGFDVDIQYIQKYKNVKYMGCAEVGDVPSILQSTDLIVLPTYYEGEGYPGIIIEAFQAGIPVVATNWKAIPEVVIDGVCGILVAPRDSRGLSNAIRSLIEDVDLYARMANEAYVRGDAFRCDNVYKEFKSSVHKILVNSGAR